jgi:hypothetical protein
MKILLWGAETWSLCKSQLDQLEIFLHRGIHRILQISITKVKENQIRNEKARKMFYSIPCAQNMITVRQANFIRKMMQGPPDQPSRNMITVCCDHKQRVGRPQMTGKNFMVENLRLLFQDVPTVHIDCYGSLRDWIHKASDNIYWNQLVDCLLHPNTPLPEHPAAWGPLPSRRARRAANNNQRPADHDEDNNDNEDNDDNGNNESNRYHQPPPSP